MSEKLSIVPEEEQVVDPQPELITLTSPVPATSTSAGSYYVGSVPANVSSSAVLTNNGSVSTTWTPVTTNLPYSNGTITIPTSTSVNPNGYVYTYPPTPPTPKEVEARERSAKLIEMLDTLLTLLEEGQHKSVKIFVKKYRDELDKIEGNLVIDALKEMDDDDGDEGQD